MSLVNGEQIVMREVNGSIIFFDVLAVTIWIIALVHYRQWRALIVAGIGFIIYYLVDAILWMTIMGIRSIETTNNINPYLVQIWLQLGPGIIHPSWVILMLEGTFGPNKHDVKREFWIILFILVQFTPAFAQQSIKCGGQIMIMRNMQSQRWVFILIGCLGYLLLVYRHLSAKDLQKIFLICTSVETCFELSLLLSDIRKASFQTVFVDCIIEFNVGAGVVFELWSHLLSKKEREFLFSGNEHIKG